MPTIASSRPNAPITSARKSEAPARLTITVKATTIRAKYSGGPNFSA